MITAESITKMFNSTNWKPVNDISRFEAHNQALKTHSINEFMRVLKTNDGFIRMKDMIIQADISESSVFNMVNILVDTGDIEIVKAKPYKSCPAYIKLIKGE